jgi:vacuole morphology and inheritance protein 14
VQILLTIHYLINILAFVPVIRKTSSSTKEDSAMSEKDYSPLPTPCFRFLTDKMYEKRKQASLEIEKLVRNFNQTGKSTEIRRLLKVLGQDLIGSPNPNWRKGGAIGLASMAVGLGKDSSNYSVELVQPIVSSLNDQDSRVRYYASEALYNVIKVIRGDILPLFNTVFDILCQLTADPDQSVKSGAELIDRLLKDIVTETKSFDVASFIPLLRERLYAKKALAQRFVVTWVQLLNDIPSIDMLIYLPELLDGLFVILSEQTADIKQMTESVLSEFKGKLLADPSRVDLTSMVEILVVQSESREPLVQLIAITWLKEFVNLISQDANKSNLLPFASNLLSAILPCLEPRIADSSDTDIQRSHASQMNVTEVAKALNHSLMQLVTRESKRENNHNLDLSLIFEVLDRELQRRDNTTATKVAVLKWIHHLHSQVPNQVQQHIQRLFPALLYSLRDPAEDVVILDLEVLARVTSSSQPTAVNSVNNQKDFFVKFVSELITLFHQDQSLLRDRGPFIIRQLCLQMSSEKVFKTLAELLLDHSDLKFAHLMINTLNRLLFSTRELEDLRQQLKELKTDETRTLFCILYKSWSHSPVATIALCLLTQNYSHALTLVTACEQLDITLEFLKEIDQLVQLLESSVFAFLRLHLLDSTNNIELIRCLYGLLMLMPQTESFHLLSQRLKCVPLATPLEKSKDNKDSRNPRMDFDELLRHFQEVQKQHEVFRRHQVEEAFNQTR